MKLPYCVQNRDVIHGVSFKDVEETKTTYVYFHHIPEHSMKPVKRNIIRWHFIIETTKLTEFYLSELNFIGLVIKEKELLSCLNLQKVLIILYADHQF